MEKGQIPSHGSLWGSAAGGNLAEGTPLYDCCFGVEVGGPHMFPALNFLSSDLGAI